MSKTILSPEDLSALRQLGDVLIPAGTKMPGFSSVNEIDLLLNIAAGATSVASDDLSAAIGTLPQMADLAAAKAFAEASPAHFALLSSVISGAYYMALEIMIALNYPLERRNPAGTSDFADEYMTGIVDPVIDNNRGAS